MLYFVAVQQHNNIDTTLNHECYSLVKTQITGNVNNRCSSVGKNSCSNTSTTFTRHKQK